MRELQELMSNRNLHKSRQWNGEMWDWKKEDESSFFLFFFFHFFKGTLCHCCQICYATVSLFPCSIWECFLGWFFSWLRNFWIISCCFSQVWGGLRLESGKQTMCPSCHLLHEHKLRCTDNKRHYNHAVVVSSSSQVRIQRQLGRLVTKTAIDPGHRWAHKNGEYDWTKIVKCADAVCFWCHLRFFCTFAQSSALQASTRRGRWSELPSDKSEKNSSKVSPAVSVCYHFSGWDDV